MPNADYMPTTDAGKANLFNNFASTYPTYAASLPDVPAAMVSAQAADAAWFSYILNHTTVMRDSATQWVNYKNLLLNGTGTTTIPVTPAIPETGAAPVDPGIVSRFRDLAGLVKKQPGYSEAMGEALGIIGPDSVGPDPETVTPAISLRSIGGQVMVVWNKGMMEAVEIQKDTGSGWQFLAVDTRPDYTDTAPFPSPPAVWKYRAIYTEDSQRTGQWSPVVEITVGV